MIPAFLLSLVEGWLGPKFGKFAKPLIYVGFALLVVTLIFVAVKIHDHRVVQNHEAQIQKRAAPATDRAADERANDTITNAKKEEELHNAVHSVPDAASAGPSHALACKRLSNAGKHPPACR